jgi:hypothetical protein
MPTEVVLSGAIAFLALMLLAAMMMKHYPRVVMMAPPIKHPCGFVPNL